MLQDRATSQGCVLETATRGYILASNRTFTAAECATLDEIVECLALDPCFSEFAPLYIA